MRHRSTVARAFVPVLLGASVLAACAGSPGSTAGRRPGPSASANPGGIVISVVLTRAGYALAGPTGMTLYMLTKDHDGVSTCTTGQCARTWGALKGDAAQVRAGAGVSGTFGVTTWSDGTAQITHNGQPLYYFIEDQYAGEAKGQGRGGTWCIAPVAYSSCGLLAAPGEPVSPTFRAPGPANHASENSDGEY